VQAAQWHGVMPLLYWQLKDICREAVPQGVLAQLGSAFNANAQKNLVLTGELLKLLKIFKSNAIPVIAFKGPVLATYAYKHIALRTFVDLDILVSEQFVPQAGKLLSAQGYEPQFNLTETQTLSYINIRNEHMFWRRDKQITVDLHWNLLPKHFSFSDNTTLAALGDERVDFGSNIVETLSAENLLLFLCAHGSKDSWWRLKAICDLAELIRSHPDLDWDAIEAQSGKLGTRRMLLLGLYLCQALLGTVLPEKVSQQVQSNPQVKLLASQVQQQMFSPRDGENKLLKQNLIYLKTMESLRDRIWFYWDTVMTPTPLEWAMVPLPSWLFPLYYPIRAIRLTIKHVMMKDTGFRGSAK
jgi:hypothetical protein